MTFLRNGILRTTGRLGAGVAATPPALSLDERTRLSWAKTIHSLAEVPGAYRGFFAALIADTPRLPYAVLTPPYATRTHKSEGALVWCRDGRLGIIEQVGSGYLATCYPLESISYVQVGSVLLQSWIKIRGVTTENVLASSELRCNAVTGYLFTPIVEQIRPASVQGQSLDLDRERDKFDYLGHENFKLMNFARRSVVPGEQIVQIVLQPELRVEAPGAFGRAFQTSCAAHICILTDKELILIEDGVGKRWGNIKYGGIWHYIPLGRLMSVALTDMPNGWINLSIRLPGDDRMDVPFSLSNRPEVEKLKRQLAKP